MKYKVEKCVQLINDLIMFCHGVGATAYHVDYVPGEEVSVFSIKAEVENLSNEQIEEIRHALTLHREQEVEEMYWSISYDTDDPCELSSIGVMLDEAIVEYDGKTLGIEGKRKEYK
jgi:hypothetical protein